MPNLYHYVSQRKDEMYRIFRRYTSSSREDILMESQKEICPSAGRSAERTERGGCIFHDSVNMLVDAVKLTTDGVNGITQFLLYSLILQDYLLNNTVF